MPRKHLELFQVVKLSDLGDHSLDNITTIFNEDETTAITDASEDLYIDLATYPGLSNVLKGVTTSNTSNVTGKSVLPDYFKFIFQVLNDLNFHIGVLQSYHAKLFRRAQSFASPERKSTKADSWKAKLPTEDELCEPLDNVAAQLRLIMYLAWKSQLFKWLITVYLAPSLLPTDDCAMEDEDTDLKLSAGSGQGGDEGEETNDDMIRTWWARMAWNRRSSWRLERIKQCSQAVRSAARSSADP